MIKDRLGARIDSLSVPHIPEAVHYAAEFYITGAGQKNRVCGRQS